MKSSCPLCHGEGQLKHLIPYRDGRQLIVLDWCLCMKSKIVSESPNFPILAGLGEAYLPLEQVDSQLSFSMEKKEDNRNLLILSETDYETFLMHIKSFIMSVKFKDPSPRILACDSIYLLKKFYVAQEDGTSPGLMAINNYDLLIFVLGMDEKNDQLGSCINQVIANRRGLKKPTWIYLKKPFDLCIYEKSDTLKEYLDAGFLKINLKDIRGSARKTNNKVKKAAEHFKI